MAFCNQGSGSMLAQQLGQGGGCYEIITNASVCYIEFTRCLSYTCRQCKVQIWSSTVSEISFEYSYLIFPT